MSVILLSVQSASDHLAALSAGPAHLTDTGIFDWVNAKTNDARTTIIRIGGVIALIFIIAAAWRARGGIGAIVAAAIGAAIFLWVLSNIDTVTDRVGNEVNSLRAPASVVVVPSSHRSALLIA